MGAESSHLEDGPGSELESRFPKTFGCPAARSNHERDSQHRNEVVHLPHQYSRVITPGQVSSAMPGVLSYPALPFPSLDCMQFLAI